MNMATQPAVGNTLVSLTGIRRTFRLGANRVEALKDVNLTLGRGEFVALQGPSGSGKSTLLHLCGLLDRADAGRYRLDGVDISGLGDRALTDLRRELIGFVFQGFNLVPVMTVFENIEYPLLLTGTDSRERRQRVLELLERVGLSDHRGHRPDQLSGGQRQRVAVARALVKRPSLVIADEPTANLDSATAARIIDLMHEMARLDSGGATFLIATHDPRMSERCDRVLSLRDGVLQ